MNPNIKPVGKSLETMSRGRQDAHERVESKTVSADTIPGGSASPAPAGADASPSRGFSHKRLAEFYHQFGTKIEAGVPIQQALGSLGRTAPRAMRPTIAILQGLIQQGESLHEAMAASPDRFAPLDYRMLAVAERSGTMDEGLFALGRFYENKAKARSQIISASIMPAIILALAVFISPLPALILSKITMGQYFVQTVGFLVSLPCVGWLVGHLWKFAMRIPYLGFGLERCVCAIPVIGRLKFNYALTRWIQSIRLLLNAGYGVLDALQDATPMVNNALISRAYAQALPHINSQMDVSQALGLSGYLPELLLQLWSTGEQSGRMDEMLDKLAKRYEEEWERSLAAFAAWMPRIIYGVVTLYVLVQIGALLQQILAVYREAGVL